jgi:large subunit ribosomal protein L17
MSTLAKLGKDSTHRRAMLRNMVTSLIKHETIIVRESKKSETNPIFLFQIFTHTFNLYHQTTVPKAKAAKRIADQMVTLAKTNTLSSRRRAHAYVFEPAAVTKLFEVLGPRFATRPGGYTSLKLTSRRPHDAAPLAFLSFLPENHPTRLERIAAKKAAAAAAAGESADNADAAAQSPQ